MVAHDKTIAWKRKRIFASFDKHSAETVAEINVSGLRGVDAAAATVYGLAIPLPKDVDPRFELGLRIRWMTDSVTAADDITWTFTADIKNPLDAIAVASTAIAVAAGTVATAVAYDTKHTARVAIAKLFSTIAQIHEGVTLVLGVNAATTDIELAADAEDLWLLGVEIDYVPMKTRQPHSETDAPLNDDLQ